MVIVQFSGGVASYIAAKRAVEKYGKDSVLCLFADVLMEDEDLYRFLFDCLEDLACQFEVLCDGRTPWQVFEQVKFLGNSQVDPCSKILKRDLLASWIMANTSNDDIIVYGLDWTEDSRLTKVEKRSPWRCWFPLAEPPYLSKADMLRFCRDSGIEPPRLYDMGFAHNNCGGACVKAGQAQWALLYKTMPDRFLWHEAQEQKLRQQLGKDVTILRDRRGGVTKPLSLARLRERVQVNDYDMFDWGGCGCAL